jgi:hypothetical protein
VLTVATAPGAAAACATRTTRSISGYVAGLDNRDVNVSIGFDVVDASGRGINVSDGCTKTSGYSAPQQEKNHYVSGEGAPRASKMYDAQGVYRGVTTRNWSLGSLPSNAAGVWIEVYSRGYQGSACTSCFGPKDVHKYGYVMRRMVKVGSTGVALRLPMTCAYSGGSTGKVYGRVFNAAGASLTPTRAMAWSIAPDNNTVPMGWGSGSLGKGAYEVSSLASGQKYVVWVTYNGVTQKRTGIAVNACKVTPLNFKF